jgi:hypothetical protein
MEGVLLIIFFVVPLILSLAGISFNPASIFADIANAIAAQIAGPAVLLAQLL